MAFVIIDGAAAGRIYGVYATAAEAVAVKASMTIGKDDSAVTFTAVTIGGGGNSITTKIVDPSANSQSLAVAVQGNAITVTLATGATGSVTTTAAQLVAAVNANTSAAALVVASADGDGTGIVEAVDEAFLTGGRTSASGVPDTAEIGEFWDGAAIRRSGQSAQEDRRVLIRDAYMRGTIIYKYYWPDNASKRAVLNWLFHHAAAAAVLDTDAAIKQLEDEVLTSIKRVYLIFTLDEPKRTPWSSRSRALGGDLYVDAWTAAGVARKTDGSNRVLTGKTFPEGFDPELPNLGLS